LDGLFAIFIIYIGVDLGMFLLLYGVGGIGSQARTSDEAIEWPLQVRYDQKIVKYGRVAEQSN